MADFEQNVQIFTSTIYGSEMKDSLVKCFEDLKNVMSVNQSKLKAMEDKITALEEGGGQNG